MAFHSQAAIRADSTIGIHPTSAEEIVTMREPVPEEPPAEAAD